MTLLTLADAKAQLNITGTSSDTELQAFVDSAIAEVEKLAGVVDARAVTEVARRRGGCSLMLMTRPVLSVTSLTSIVDASVYDVTALYVDSALAGIVRRKDQAAIWGGPWTAVYQAGRTSVPANLNLAARMMVEHLWETQRGAAQVNPPALSFATESATPGVWFAIPNKVRELCEGESVPMVAY